MSWERWQRAGGSGRLGQVVTSRWPQPATARVWLRWLCCLGAGSSLELSLCLRAALCHQFVPTWLHWGPPSPPGPPRGHGSLVPGGLGLHGWWQRAQRVPGPLPCPLRVPSQLRVASRGGAAAGREGWQELGLGRGGPWGACSPPAPMGRHRTPSPRRAGAKQVAKKWCRCVVSKPCIIKILFEQMSQEASGLLSRLGAAKFFWPRAAELGVSVPLAPAGHGRA